MLAPRFVRTALSIALLLGTAAALRAGEDDPVFSDDFEPDDVCRWSAFVGWTGSGTFYLDGDQDTYGDTTQFTTAPGCSPPANYVLPDGDCNDSDEKIHPGAPDVCDGIDSNCNQLDCDVETICDNDFDDDGDGFTDCNDSSCANDPVCASGSEICDNGKDDDEDGFTDCKDADCANDPVCPTPEVCDNGQDDDEDGFTDCSDSDCANEPVCD